MFNAQLVPENTELIDDIIFPEVGDTQVIIPANAIVHQRATESKYIFIYMLLHYSFYVLNFRDQRASCQLYCPKLAIIP